MVSERGSFYGVSMWRAKAVLAPAVSSERSVSGGSNVLYAGDSAAEQPRWLAGVMASRRSRQEQAEEWSAMMRVVVPALMIAILMMLVISGMPLFGR